MKAGAARIDITPPLGTPLAGSCTLRLGQRLVDRLYAKALVLEQEQRRCAIVTADLCAFDEKMVQRLRNYCSRQHGIGLLLCNASHTHSAPDSYNEFCTYNDRWALASRRRYQQQLEQKIQRLIPSAVRQLRPVLLSYGTGRAKFGINRRKTMNGECRMMPNPKGVHDKTVSVFRFATPKNTTIAVLFSYACHPTVRYDGEISADYPGPAQQLIEKRTGGIALFAQGASGDIRPNITQVKDGIVYFNQGTQADVTRCGKELGTEVLRVLRNRLKPLHPRLEWKAKVALLPFDRFYSEAELRAYSGGTNMRPADYQKLQILLEKLIKRIRRHPPSKWFPMELVLLCLSSHHAILATNHELCNPYVPIFQQIARGKTLTVLGYTNACGAYIPTRKIRMEGGYEGERSFVYWPALPCPFHPSVEAVLTRACRELFQSKT